MRAVDGGILRFDGGGGGTFDNTNGMIEALAGSEVRLDEATRIDGGTIRSVGDGIINIPASQNIFLSDLTLEGQTFANNNSDLGLPGTSTIPAR